MSLTVEKVNQLESLMAGAMALCSTLVVFSEDNSSQQESGKAIGAAIAEVAEIIGGTEMRHNVILDAVNNVSRIVAEITDED
jgi:hypothetical protein